MVRARALEHRLAVTAALAIGLGAASCRGGCAPKQVPVRAPAELADAQSLALLGDWSALPVFGAGRYRQQSSEDRGNPGPSPQAIWLEGNRDMNNFMCASADASPKPEGTPFLLDAPTCADDYVQGYVMARFVGSGRLARLWLTADSLRRGGADREVLRIYVDAEREPVVEAPLRSILDGSAGELFARPFGAGSSRRMAWYYPLVFASKLVVSLDRLSRRDLYFHQTAVVLDPAPTARKAPPARLPERDRVLAALRSDVPLSGKHERSRAVVAAEPPTVLARLQGPATIVRAELSVPADRVASLAELLLQVRWDGSAEPAIAVPASVLFVTDRGLVGPSSPALSAEQRDGRVRVGLGLPMPFAQSAEWTAFSQGAEPVDVELDLQTVAGVPAAPYGLLHVQTFETRSKTEKAHPLAKANRRGRLVGVCALMEGGELDRPGMRGHPMNFLEGDELGIVDGERAMAGTGTEDYFNHSFYFEDGATASPFSQTWGIEPAVRAGHGAANACRWHVLGDAVDFASSLDLRLEIGPGDPRLLDRFFSVAYLYLAPS